MELVRTCIITEDVERLRDFYARVLRIEPTDFLPHYVEFRTPQAILALYSREAIEEWASGATVGAANRSVILEFEVEDVDEECLRLQQMNIESVMPPTDHPWGTRAFLFRDPDGNLVNFFTPVEAA